MGGVSCWDLWEILFRFLIPPPAPPPRPVSVGPGILLSPMHFLTKGEQRDQVTSWLRKETKPREGGAAGGFQLELAGDGEGGRRGCLAL
uniref:Uncharacterized protein n=1 Tax=Chrysemys picta bellii TaxID=8478 RepID=A0A8C3I217_CHRPI